MRWLLPLIGVASVVACATTDPSSGSAAPVSTRPGGANQPTALLLPTDWAACEKDAECTYLSLGCCDTTPVNRAHAAEGQRIFDASGLPFCAPKNPCGPSAKGTWAGEPGKCRDHYCQLPGPE